MSPEQAEGRLDSLGPATDVYSLGATLYCLLTGRAPIAYAEVQTMIEQVSQGDFPRPRLIKNNVPPALEAICLKAMALKPEERYDSPKSLADDVARWMADEAVTCWKEPISARIRRWARRQQLAAASLLFGSALIVAMTLMGLGCAAYLSFLMHAARAGEEQLVIDIVNGLLSTPRSEDSQHLREGILTKTLGYWKVRLDAPGTGRNDRVQILQNIGVLAVELKRSEEAQQTFLEILSILDSDESDVETKLQRATIYCQMAMLSHQVSDSEGAKQWCRQFKAIQSDLVDDARVQSLMRQIEQIETQFEISK